MASLTACGGGGGGSNASNPPPVLTNVHIEPPIATTYETLTAAYQATDPDNEPLSATFRWDRNDTPIAGATTATLTPDNFVRGDVIKLTVSVSDGKTTVTASAATTVQNAVPIFTSIDLTPYTAYTTDDLVFTASTRDPDGDTLQVTYEWRRNGTTIPGQTAATLPASEHQRGDLIEVLATVDDGFDSSTTTVATTIQDTAPVVTIVAPDTVSYGNVLTFTASAFDVDGDPLGALGLDYGPPGMTFDAATGTGTWVATTPMFGTTMEIHWRLRTAGAYSAQGDGTVVVSDPARPDPLLRGATDVPVGRSAIQVDDFDGDGDVETLILGDASLYELDSDGSGGYRQSWVNPFALDEGTAWTYGTLTRLSSFATGDFDGDGRKEIVVAAGARIVVLDGVDRREVRSANIGAWLTCTDLEVADLDGDGADEVVCLWQHEQMLDSGLLVLEANDLSERWRFPSGNYGDEIRLGNVDGDAALEIVTNAGQVFDGATFATEWEFAPGFGTHIAVGDLEGDGKAEIVGNEANLLRAFDAASRSQLWEADMTLPVASVQFANVDADPVEELVIGSYNFGDVAAFDYDAPTKTLTDAFRVNVQGTEAGAVGVGDIDGDGQAEFVWGTTTNSNAPEVLVIAGSQPTPNVEWRSDTTARLGRTFVGGELANAPLVPQQAVFSAETYSSSDDRGTAVVAIDMTTGDLIVGNQLGNPVESWASIAVTDYDADGIDEAFVGTGENFSRIVAYDPFGGAVEWETPTSTTYTSFPAIATADYTGDGRDEAIAVTSSGAVVVYDVFGQALVWESAGTGKGEDVAVGDIDGDGTPEIFAASDNTVTVYKRVTAPAQFVQFGSVGAPATIADLTVRDVDGDGNQELLVMSSQGTNTLVQTFDANLQQVATIALPWSSTALSTISGLPGVIALAATEGTDYTSASFVVGVDLSTGAELWRSPRLLGTIAANSLHFTELPSGQDWRVAIGTDAGMYVTQ